jgi:hypothetical protein
MLARVVCVLLCVALASANLVSILLKVNTMQVALRTRRESLII